MDYHQHAIKLFDFQLLHLELNSLLFMVILALVVMLLMNWLLFRPVLRTLDARAELMQRLQGEVESQRKELDQLSQIYRQDLARVRAQVEQVRHQAHAEAQREVEHVMQQARQTADA
ncbi:MAG TPA: ATP synthase F0 subunit B, partial [bacterium]|nr:ATP synthase F0 subunit B [bacterium]